MKELGEITAIMALSTVVAYIFQWFGLSESNLIMTYMVGVLLSSYVADKKYMHCILPCLVFFSSISFLRSRILV